MRGRLWDHSLVSCASAQRPQVFSDAVGGQPDISTPSSRKPSGPPTCAPSRANPSTTPAKIESARTIDFHALERLRLVLIVRPQRRRSRRRRAVLLLLLLAGLVVRVVRLEVVFRADVVSLQCIVSGQCGSSAPGTRSRSSETARDGPAAPHHKRPPERAEGPNEVTHELVVQIHRCSARRRVLPC
jgi:hypothetical protein